MWARGEGKSEGEYSIIQTERMFTINDQQSQRADFSMKL